MPRRTRAASSVTASVNELVTDLLGKVGHEIQSHREVGTAARHITRVACVTGTKIGAKVKAAWARLTPAQRKARRVAISPSIPCGE